MDDTERSNILDTAIVREVAAHVFYKEAAARVKNPAVRTMFLKLAAEELGHKELLERFKNDTSTIRKMGAPSVDFKIAETEEAPVITDEISFRNAVAFAMKKEQQAVELYTSLAASASGEDLKGVFTNLANMESGHKHTLETLFTDIGYPEVF